MPPNLAFETVSRRHFYVPAFIESPAVIMKPLFQHKPRGPSEERPARQQKAGNDYDQEKRPADKREGFDE